MSIAPHFTSRLKSLTPVWVALSALSICACQEDPSDTIQAGNSTVIADNPSDVSTANQTVCDPFQNDPNHPSYAGAAAGYGLTANLFYIPTGDTTYSSVMQYQQYGIEVDSTLFMNQVYVPTRNFDLGFSNQNGQLLVDNNGNTLYEYFSLHFLSQVTLGSGDVPGPYQFAILSDDGSILQMDLGSGMEQIVNNDGTHPSRFEGSSFPVYLSAGQTIPLQYDYFQGPRYQIALILLMRPWPTNPSQVNDPEFGQEGNGTFFNYNDVPSQPTSTWNGILARGWKVMTPDNFVLPATITTNPCVVTTVPTTSIVSQNPTASLTNQTYMVINFSSNDPSANFVCSLNGSAPTACVSPVSYSSLTNGNYTFEVYAVNSYGQDPTGAEVQWTVDTTPPTFTLGTRSWDSSSFTVTYTTDEPTTTAGTYGVSPNSNTAVIPTDPTLVTSHTITVSGLPGATRFQMQISGTDAAGNTFTSSAIAIQTD